VDLNKNPVQVTRKQNRMTRLKNSENDVGSDDETANPSERKKSNKITAEQDDEPQTENAE
jgi:hypothetical protein